MLTRLLYKWFGLESPTCLTCELLREQLHRSEAERRELLTRLLERDKPEPLIEQPAEMKPIMPQHIPWRVRQQMLEQEDRKRVQLTKDKEKEIAELEKELGVNHEVNRGESGGLKARVE